MRRSNSRDGIGLGKEIDDGLIEGIIAVAGDHMPGAGDVDIACVRHMLAKMFGLSGADDLALAAPDQKGRHVNMIQGRHQPLLIGAGLQAPGADKLWVPVPKQPAIDLPEVASEARDI